MVIFFFWALASKLYVKLIFWFQNLDIERAVWSEVLCSPSPQNSLMILQHEKYLFQLYITLLINEAIFNRVTTFCLGKTQPKA